VLRNLDSVKGSGSGSGAGSGSGVGVGAGSVAEFALGTDGVVRGVDGVDFGR